MIAFTAGCSTYKYYQADKMKYKPDLDRGKWLVNHIETDLHLKANRRLTNKLLQHLEKYARDSVYFIEDHHIPGLGQELIKYNADRDKLRILKEETHFDYFINSRIYISENFQAADFQKVSIPESDLYVIMNLDIYNIHTGEVFYKQQLVRPINSRKKIFNSFSMSPQRRIFRILKRGMKELEIYAHYYQGPD